MTAVTDHDHRDHLKRMDHTSDYPSDFEPALTAPNHPAPDPAPEAPRDEGRDSARDRVGDSAPDQGQISAERGSAERGSAERDSARDQRRELLRDHATDSRRDQVPGPVRGQSRDSLKDRDRDRTGDPLRDQVGDSAPDPARNSPRGSSQDSPPVEAQGRDGGTEESAHAPAVSVDVPENAPANAHAHANSHTDEDADLADLVELTAEAESVPHARVREQRVREQRERTGDAPNTDGTPAPAEPPGAADDVWDDGLIARRSTDATAKPAVPVLETRGPGAPTPVPLAYEGPLRSRLDALRELVGLSRTRLDSRTLAEAGRVLDEAAARRKLSGQHTVVAIAGATGSGKSQLFNALAGVAISETGVRRPTTAAPIACSWSDGSAALIDRLGIPGRLRRRPVHNPEADAQLRGLILIDLPDHDSAAVQHREQVDRILKLVDAVIWVVDPEKYADAVLHERYLRPMAGHAEVMFVILNQTDRLPGEATHQVLDDLRRLLDDDGVALGEHGDPGATVLALSALTGDGVGELREALGQFVSERGAAARRVAADVDAAAARLRPVYATGRRPGLTEEARDEFAARLADAVGATAAGDAAERAWRRNANRACGTPWLRLWRWHQGRGGPPTGRLQPAPPEEEATARQRVEHAVRALSERASAGLPDRKSVV